MLDLSTAHESNRRHALEISGLVDGGNVDTTRKVFVDARFEVYRRARSQAMCGSRDDRGTGLSIQGPSAAREEKERITGSEGGSIILVVGTWYRQPRQRIALSLSLSRPRLCRRVV
jgi:hypothetical protein